MKKRMYALLICLIFILTATACGKSKNPADVASPDSAETSGEETAGEAKVINSLPSEIDINSMNGFTVKASFTTDDFNWRGGNLSFTAYTDILYDASDISDMKVGDTIVTDNGEVVVKTTNTLSDGSIVINENTEEEVSIVKNQDGTYGISYMDDLRGVKELGTVEMPLADDVRFTDCTSEPGEKVEVPSEDIKIYLDDLDEMKASFYYIDTIVSVESGQIIEITRSWRP